MRLSFISAAGLWLTSRTQKDWPTILGDLVDVVSELPVLRELIFVTILCRKAALGIQEGFRLRSTAPAPAILIVHDAKGCLRWRSWSMVEDPVVVRIEDCEEHFFENKLVPF